ncbi:MAG TPA: hypothetical protein QGF35_06480 [Dehalococcoidia bacterium]|jgi:hypothetical protein|nr:hypothetical protein [Dehalococcoidia bacterium]
MRPRADEVLHSAIWSYDTYVVPEVEEPFAKSIALTVGNLLRHVNARLEHEGQAIFDDITEMRACLAATRSFVAEIPPGRDHGTLPSLSDRIDQALGASYLEPGQYPSLRLITNEALALRGILDEVIRALQASRKALGDSSTYGGLRRQIRRCLRHQLERQKVWDSDALSGERR